MRQIDNALAQRTESKANWIKDEEKEPQMTRAERLERLKFDLMTRRDELRSRAGGRSQATRTTSTAVGDAADIAQYNESSDLNTHLIAMKADELSEIEHALMKFQEDAYGVCELTGKSIPIARLEAMPLTRYSVDAQREAEEKTALWS